MKLSLFWLVFSKKRFETRPLTSVEAARPQKEGHDDKNQASWLPQATLQAESLTAKKLASGAQSSVQWSSLDSLSTKRQLQCKLKPNVTQLWKQIKRGEFVTPHGVII